MIKRIVTGVILAAILIPLVILGDWYFIALAAVLAYIANYELLAMFSKKDAILSKLKFTMPMLSSFTIIFCYLDSTMILPLIVAGTLVFMIGMVLNKCVSANTCIMLIFSYMYGGFLFYLTTILRDINVFVIAIVFITVMLTDVGGYMFGYLFGKHKLCPNISPKKTIEGAILGTLFGVACGVGCYFLVTRGLDNVVLLPISNLNLGLEILSIVGIILLLSIVGQLGDLVASKLKRAYDIKDFGKIFPGHGGVLDRFDSTLIACAIMYVICYMIGVI